MRYLLTISFLSVCFCFISCSKDNDKSSSENSDQQVSAELNAATDSICWVAFAPTNFDPNSNLRPNDASISEDLRLLHRVGFTGFVTYGIGIVDDGIRLLNLAESIGFDAVILGVWDPSDTVEVNRAIAFGSHDIVLGFCIGNEGLGNRYGLSTLQDAIQRVKNETGKPTTTSEEIDDYRDEVILMLGDWVFPNVHPYWHSVIESNAAVEWTVDRYNELKQKTERVIIFKEVGLPTAGGSGLGETAQAKYYQLLSQTEVDFVYFEAFDQFWKSHEPVEPHWGIFRRDRTAKEAVELICTK